MIDVLVAGVLIGCAERRTDKRGKPYTLVTVKARADGGGSYLVNAVAFGGTAQAVLLGLVDGDAVALAGVLMPKAATDAVGDLAPRGLNSIQSD